MVTVPEIREAIDEFHRQIEEIVHSVDASALHWHENENTWSVAQILAHVAEFEQFFADDIRNLNDAPGSRFGRTMEHEQRLRAVRLTGQETLQELIAKTKDSKNYINRVMAGLTDADLSVEGVNPKFGKKSIEWIVDHFIIEHLEKHIGQLKHTLGTHQTA